MKPTDAIFFAAVAWLPIIISIVMFRREPETRPFLATFALAIIGSSMAFVALSLALLATGVNTLGMSDGLLELALSIPIALIAGLTVRIRRARRASSFSRV